MSSPRPGFFVSLYLINHIDHNDINPICYENILNRMCSFLMVDR
jgi:hypothetical protein